MSKVGKQQSKTDQAALTNWKAGTLSEVLATLRNGFNCKQDKLSIGDKVSRIESISTGVFDLSRVGFASIPDRDKEKFKLQQGDILFSHINSPIHVGKTAIFDVDEEVYHGVNLLLMRPAPALIPGYLRHYLNFLYTSGYWKRICKQSVNQASVNQQDIGRVPIMFPIRTEEQERIVTILDEAFESISIAKATVQKNLENARTLFENFINVAIQGRLVTPIDLNDSTEELIKQIEKSRREAIVQGRAKPQKTSPSEMTGGERFKLPNSWKWAHLESLTIGISDGVHKKPEYVSTGIPFVTVKNLTSGPGISFESLNYVTKDDHQEFIKRTHPENGDILITKDGTIGVVRLIETDIEFSIFVSVALVKPVMKQLAPYLVYALRASCVQSQIVPQGTALKHLYLVDLRRLSIPLPPLSEQHLIVSRLNALNDETQRLESIYERKLAALEDLKQSLLDQAFSGNL